MFVLRGGGGTVLSRLCTQLATSITKTPTATTITISNGKLSVAAVRHFSCPHVNPDNIFLHLTELQQCGATSESHFNLDEMSTALKNDAFNLGLPPRDLKIFFRSHLESKSSNAVLARPDSKCFLLELEHIKLICFANKCLILNPDHRVVRDFLTGLQQGCRDPLGLANAHNNGKVERSSTPALEFHNLLTSNIQHMDFEHVVLEHALNNITSWFSRHVWLTKPALELLLQKITQFPSGLMLRRLLAFRKSLGEFELSVNQVKRAVDDLLRNDEVSEVVPLVGLWDDCVFSANF